jgi:arylsulfatase A-like enzyme
MGDNGYFHGEHGLADKWYPYEESVRVPLIVFDPRLKSKERNSTNNEFVLNIDIAPAIVTAAGLNIPEVMQGSDFSKLYLSGSKPAWRKDFYYEHPFITSEKRIPSSEALITHTSKYIFWPNFQHEEFFDLLKDPFEKHNGILDAANEKIIIEMKARFEELKSQAQ